MLGSLVYIASEENPVRVLAAEQDISRPLIDAALRYRDAYPDEVETRIAGRAAVLLPSGDNLSRHD